MKNIFKLFVVATLIVFIAGSCQKKERPELGDYPKDANPPGGPLKFYAAFDGTTSNPLMNAVDSIRANFPSDNPLVSVDGVNGKAIQGTTTKAIIFPSANDFKDVTSCTISMWVNNTVNPNTELYFSLVDKDYWHESSAFLLVEHAKVDACTFKFALMDHWVEFTNQSFQKPLFDGQWHHLAFTYDENTSKLLIYFDGQMVPTPGTQADFMTGGAPLGKLNLKNASNLVLSGWNKHVGLSGPTDGWISAFSGKMDQFRLYGKVLTATEIQALYNSKM
ncbi:MAG TPA: LamG domain-containing protein, partial [Chitinophagaceae bacterium]|nr:LamG domain-containing protein [Chitinophagaceae bacterium]